MATIGEFVRLDDKAEFRSDVQLDAIEKPDLNMGLLRSYIFTTHTPPGYRPSLGLLVDVRNTFIGSPEHSRLVVVADYGHGKSHTALALANFFAKPIDSEEIQILHEKISQAVATPEGAVLLRTFKESKGKFLVVRLRGDVHASLRDQFVANLKRALQEHSETQDVQIPFWSREAEVFLKKLDGPYLVRANRFLEDYSLDVPALLSDLNSDRYQLCVNLHREVYGTTTNFGGQVSLKEVVNWVVKKFCGPGKVFGGFLVLFDEFSAYVMEYARRGASNELQDLLNGIDDHRGLATFMAFAQNSPGTTARNAIGSGPVLDSILRELNRITTDIRLATLLESVIDAYLKQNDDEWNQTMQIPGVRNLVQDASYTTYDLFSKRYKESLEWSTSRFIGVVTKGCFPLHPLTTALLCNLQFQSSMAGIAPRTVLGFVFQQVREIKKDQPVILDGKPNWVLPIELVDYFRDQISKEKFALYSTAYDRMGGGIAPEEAKRFIKALLIQYVADLPIPDEETQTAVLAQMAGLNETDIKAAGQYLIDRGVVRRESVSKKIQFYSGSTDFDAIENLLATKLGKTDLEEEDFLKLGQNITRIEPVIDWAKPSDWATPHYFMRVSDFKPEKIRTLAFRHTPSSKSLKAGTRGCVIWCIAQDHRELDDLTKKATSLLDEALAEPSPIPVLVVLPRLATPELFEILKRKKALESFTNDERERGKDVFSDMLKQADEEVQNALAINEFDENSIHNQRSADLYRVSSKYTHGLMGLTNTSPSHVITSLYQYAYKLSPTGFDFSYAASKMREAIRLIGKALLQNQVNIKLAEINASPVANNVLETVLKIKWQILNTSYKIQAPKAAHVKAAWDYFDKSFSPKKQNVEVGPVLAELFNPPYGYDTNSASVVFCAWLGYNFRYLRITENLYPITMNDLLEHFAKDPKDLIDYFCSTDQHWKVQISRKELSETLKRIKEINTRISEGTLPYTIDEAKRTIRELDEFLTDENVSDEEKERYKPSKEELVRSIELALTYSKSATDLANSIQNENSPRNLLAKRKPIEELPRCTLVMAEGKTPDELRGLLNSRLAQTVNSHCGLVKNFKEISQYGLVQVQLKTLLDQLSSAGLTSLTDQINDAMKELTQRKEYLEKQQQEKGTLNQIASMDSSANLIRLLEYMKTLEGLQGYSDTVNQQRNSKQAAIQGRISEIVKGVEELIQEVGGVSTTLEADSWYREWVRYHEKIVGTKWENELRDANQRFASVQAIFSRLATLHFTANTKSDIHALSATIDAIEKEYQQQLTEGTRKAIDAARERVSELKARKQSEARQTLEKISKDFAEKGSNYFLILQRLELIPDFLAESEGEQWLGLKQQVRSRMDEESAKTILDMFKTMKDSEKREKLLTELGKLHKEI